MKKQNTYIVVFLAIAMSMIAPSTLAKTTLQDTDFNDTCMTLIADDSSNGLSICIDTFTLEEAIVEVVPDIENMPSDPETDITQEELIANVASTTGLSEEHIASALNGVLSAITSALKKEESVSLGGFGIFEITSQKALTGINPQTGEEIRIKAKKIPSFKAGKSLKDDVN